MIDSPALAAQLEARTRELVQAADQLAATSEVLRAISNSRRDPGPVLKAVAEHAARLCDADITQIFQIDGELLRVVASHGPIPSRLRGEALRVTRGSVTGRSVIDRRTIHVHDLSAELDTEFPDAKPHAGLWGHRTTLAIPLLREGAPIGAIFIRRTEVRPFSEQQIALLETFADQAVIAIENVRLFKELEARNRELTEALEQQTATSEILRVISSSPTNLQPVMDAVAQNAARLCGATDAVIFRLDGDVLRRVAVYGTLPLGREVVPLTRDSVTGRVVVDRQTIHLHNFGAAFEAEFPDTTFRSFGVRTALGTPLLREGVPIGALLIRRIEERPFSEKQIALLQTFANQAVIAIENVRLFNETKEALERQTATAEILRVISSSPTDVQPVFDAIVESCTRLLACSHSTLRLIKGDRAEIVASNSTQGTNTDKSPMPLDDDSLPTTQAVMRQEVVQIPDTFADGVSARIRQRGEQRGFRSLMIAPMLRESSAMGTIHVHRATPGRFTEKEVALLETFASQAVIAIENVRLFNETKEALEQQRATGEILASMSESIIDAKPVFDAIVRNLLRLFGTRYASVALVRDGKLEIAGIKGDRGYESLVKRFPVPINDQTLVGRVALAGKVMQFAPMVGNPAVPPGSERFAREFGFNSQIMAPMIRDGEVIGVISTAHRDAVLFDEQQVALLKSFAAQAVIAIENVRLFNETKEALEQQTATSEILGVISRSPTDVTPVFDAILKSALQLCEAHLGHLHLYDGELYRTVAMRGASAEFAKYIAERGPYKSEGGVARATAERRPVHFPDLRTSPGYLARKPNTVKFVELGGARTALNVPLLKDDKVLGVLVIYRPEVRPFTEKQIALVSLFANQAVIAIENVRLFNETKEALEQQTATSEILGVISASPTDLAPVFDAILKRGLQLCEAHLGHLHLYDGEFYRTVAQRGATAEFAKYIAERGPYKAEGVVLRAVPSAEPVHIPDLQQTPAYLARKPNTVKFVELGGARTCLSVPLLKEGKVLGVLVIYRSEVRPFSEKQIALISLFASQAVIAIENVRLFNETKEALEQQKASAEVLGTISSSIADPRPVFEKIVESCARLFEGHIVGIGLIREDGLLYADAYHGPQREEFLKAFPMPVDHNSGTGRAILSRQVMHYPDVIGGDDVPPNLRRSMEKVGAKSAIVAPMLWEGRGIGGIVVQRQFAGRFSEKAIRQLKTFADQAVIAIQNARLFNETKESLEQQTATAEILRVISSTPTDIQPVFDAIAKSAMRIFEGMEVSVALVDGNDFVIKATSVDHARVGVGLRVPLDRDSAGARSVLDRIVVNIADTESAEAPPLTRQRARDIGFRAFAAAPMLKEGTAIGHIAVMRQRPIALSEKQIALLRTFADQAVIAIENTRLFKELQERTEALTKSVSQLTALGEVGQAISSTLELETVLKTIVSRAVQLTGLDAGAIYEYDEGAEEFHLRAAQNLSEDVLEILRSRPIKKGDGAVGGTAVVREPIQIPETQDESYKSGLRDLIIRAGRRALLAVPLMREDHIIGALAVQRNTPGPFAPEVVELLKTFATQSAMAIQNARLFREIAEKSRQLEVASRHKSQFLASMSHELRTPLNAILGFNEMVIDEIYGPVPEGMKSPLENIQSSGKHLLRLINNVLDLAKIEAGRMELALSDYSVQDMVSSVYSTLRPLAAEKGLDFVAEVSPDIPTAHGDAGRLAQCLMNLAGNSLKFTRQGRVAIAAAQRDGLLRFSVADTGIGIPPEKIGSLFTEFKQTDATIASEYGGTGLGLSITKKFIEMHGGRIWVESELGKGSNFLFEIPLRVGR